MAGQAFQVTDALKDKKQQQDFSYSSALKTPIFTKRDRAQLILIFSAVIKVKGKPSLSYIPLVTPSGRIGIIGQLSMANQQPTTNHSCRDAMFLVSLPTNY